MNDLLQNFKKEFEDDRGSFLKSSTRVKVVTKDEIKLYVWRKAVVSDFYLGKGDIVILQDLGDLL